MLFLVERCSGGTRRIEVQLRRKSLHKTLLLALGCMLIFHAGALLLFRLEPLPEIAESSKTVIALSFSAEKSVQKFDFDSEPLPYPPFEEL